MDLASVTEDIVDMEDTEDMEEDMVDMEDMEEDTEDMADMEEALAMEVMVFTTVKP
jgi:hypothetical protein